MSTLTSIDQLDLRLADAKQLLDIHGTLTGDGRGRRYDVDSLNRSAVILAVAAWEAFVEELAFRNAAALARRLKKADDLPDMIRDPLLVWIYEKGKFQTLTRDARMALWSLAGNGWRTEFREFSKAKCSNLNTPNSENVRKLFRITLGIEDITNAWGYRRWSAEVYKEKLDALLKLRHKIAHGVVSRETVGKTSAREAISLVRSLGVRSVVAVSDNFRNFDLQGRRAKIRPA